MAARRQDGREREGGRGRVERRREEDETHASWRHRCQSRPPRGRAFLGKWITGQFFASQECVKRAMLDDSLQSGTRVASYWYRFANARPQNSRPKLAWLASCKTLATFG